LERKDLVRRGEFFHCSCPSLIVSQGTRFCVLAQMLEHMTFQSRTDGKNRTLLGVKELGLVF
jgi:hypothetical protein